MTAHLSREKLSRLLRSAECVFVTAGVGLLAWCGLVLWQAREFQQTESLALDVSRGQAVPASLTTDSPEPARALSARQQENALRATTTGLIGRIEVPRLGLAVIVIEGSDQAVLRRAAGHVPGTALPGQPGNIAITGHRDTFFRPLRNISQGDLIRITTPKSQFSYRVTSISVVGADDARVLGAHGNEELTLITCFPFSFVGPAPRRFVVRAERVTF